MEVPVHELDIDNIVLELSASSNNADTVPVEDAVFASNEIWYTV